MIIKQFIYILHTQNVYKEELIKIVQNSNVNILDKSNIIHYIDILTSYILKKNYNEIKAKLPAFLSTLKEDQGLETRLCKINEFFKCHDYLQNTYTTSKVEENLQKHRKYLLHILYIFIKSLFLLIVGLIFLQFFLQIINRHNKNKHYNIFNINSK